MERFERFLILFLGVVLPGICCQGREQGTRPNVILIITDDQGYGDLGRHGNRVLKTPNLDRLHDEAVRLADYHVSPTCSPTRAALQTGRWSNRTGVWHTITGRSILRENEITMGQVFRDAGYATGLFGKWHLGDNYPSRPEDRGYSEVLRHGGGGVGQTPDYWDNAYFGGTYYHNSAPERVDGFCTDVWFRYAREFIRSQKEAGRPFFALISTNAPHGPMHSPAAFSAPYLEHGLEVANFFGMITNIDENVGRLRDFLEEQDLAENTVLIFTTDNGTSSGDVVYNAGMRGRKGSEYDGGHRVPFFIYWPAGGLVGGRVVTAITAHVDVLPTLIDLCGISSPPGVRFDGRSIRPLLDGSATVESQTWPDRILITDSQRVKDPVKWRKSCVMTNRWRLINGEELYDIQLDHGQEYDLADRNPEAVRRLRNFYEEWWSELEPSFRQEALIYVGHPDENPVRLTSHDWITTEMTPWNQAQIREGMRGPSVTGYWNIRVWVTGPYEIILRRWPRESGAAIDAGLPPGRDAPGERAFRARPGESMPIVRARLRVGDQQEELPVSPGLQEVVFRTRLSSGVTCLEARFLTGSGEELGAYYAYVRRY